MYRNYFFYSPYHNPIKIYSEFFGKYGEKLKKLSLDSSNNIVVCDKDRRFINFDKLKKECGAEALPKSPDMLFIDFKKKEVLFVEFKSSQNIYEDSELMLDLRKKIMEGIIAFYHIFGYFFKYKKTYLVVHPKESSNREELRLNILSMPAYHDLLEDLPKKGIVSLFDIKDCESFLEFMKKNYDIDMI